MKTAIHFLPLLLSLVLPVTAHAAPYKVAEVKDGGSISGKVTFSGKDPAPRIYNIAKDNEVCGTGDREVDYVKVSNGGLSDVVVYLDKVKTGKDFANGSGKLDQKGCEFTPFLQVMVNKKKLDIINSDPVMHNIHTYELIGRTKRTVINISQPDQGSITKKIKLRRGDAMKIECDAHDFMHGFVFVTRHPYYALVGKDGSFTIDDIPAGKYTIKAWHGSLGEQKSKVTVSANGKVSVNFAFKAK